MEELISIIVPIYNVEKYIHRCIDSIINQTYKNIEIILVDDGSSDNSGLICDEYAKKENRINVVHKENGGLGFARNSGLDVAKGKYVTFIDGDDYIGETHIVDMVSLIDRTGTDTCLAGHTKVYANKEVEHKNVCSGKVFKGNAKEEILPRMCGANAKGEDYIEMSVCMVLLSNDIIKQNNLRFHSEREFVSEDLVFDFDYYPLSKGVCIADNVDYFYCDNEGSLTTKYRKDRFENQINLYNYLLDKSKELGIEDLCKERLQNTTIAIARYCIKLEYKFESAEEKAKANIKNICENETLQSLLLEHNYGSIRLASRLVNFFIEHRLYWLLKLTMKFKNFFNI